MIDPTTLRDTAQALLDVLEDAADDVPWTPANVAVTATRPAYDCDSIYVWPESARMVRAGNPPGKCFTVINVTYRWGLSVCIGAAEVEDDAFWAEHAAKLDRVWGVIGRLVQAGDDCTLGSMLGVGKDCSNVTVGDAARFDSGDLFVWEGNVSVALPVSALGS